MKRSKKRVQQKSVKEAEICKTCHFHEWPEEWRNVGLRGECRHKSPERDPETGHARWPETLFSFWCGDWEKKRDVSRTDSPVDVLDIIGDDVPQEEQPVDVLELTRDVSPEEES